MRRSKILPQAQDDLAQGDQRVGQAQRSLANAQSDAGRAAQASKEAQTAKDAADAELVKVQQSESEANSAYQAALDLVEEKQKAQNAADAVLNAAQSEKDNADQAVLAAQAALDEARQAFLDAQAAYSSGAFGFFEYVGATDALDALNKSQYASYTKKGDAKDATSLDNMRKTIQYMKECNELRAAHGLPLLTVTYTLMAMAQADANYSDTIEEHAKQFPVGENVAWNYGTDPFTQWYDKEKAKYEQTGNRNEAGHYFNIIEPSYTTTGFAVTTRGSMNGWTTYAQVFSVGAGMTVDEYAARFNEYCDSLETVQDKVTQAQQKLDAAKQDAANKQVGCADGPIGIQPSGCCHSGGKSGCNGQARSSFAGFRGSA